MSISTEVFHQQGFIEADTGLDLRILYFVPLCMEALIAERELTLGDTDFTAYKNARSLQSTNHLF
jgi:hypothetical protein